MSRTHDEYGQVIYLDHPVSPLVKPLTEKQAALLDRICRTNGGGINIYDADKSALRGLMRRHFVQGKAGQAGRIVHTREGLAAWKQKQALKATGGDHE